MQVVWIDRKKRKREAREKEEKKRALINWKVTSVLFCNDRKQLCYVFLKQTIFELNRPRKEEERWEKRKRNWQLTETTKLRRCESRSHFIGWCLEFIWSFNEWIRYLETHERKVIFFSLSRTFFFKHIHRNSSVPFHDSQIVILVFHVEKKEKKRRHRDHERWREFEQRKKTRY